MKKILIIVVILLLVITNIIVATFAATNYFNLDNSFNRDRSDRKVNEKFYYYQYPSSSPPLIEISENGTKGLPTFSVQVEIKYTGILAEGTPVFLAAQGLVYPDGQQISGIQVGYQGASWYPNIITNVSPYFDVNPQYTDIYSFIIPDNPVKGIYIKWDTQGDFYPFVVLSFKNGSAPVTLPLNDPKVHVYGLEAIQQQKDARSSIGLTAISLIGIPDISVTIGYLLKKIKRPNKAHPKPIHSNPKGQTDPKQRNKERPKNQRRNK